MSICRYQNVAGDERKKQAGLLPKPEITGATGSGAARSKKQAQEHGRQLREGNADPGAPDSGQGRQNQKQGQKGQRLAKDQQIGLPVLPVA